MKKGVLAIAGLIVLAGAVAAGVPVLEDRTASRIKSEIEGSGTAHVGVVEVGLFNRRIALVDFKSSDGDAEFAVGRWEASGIAWPIGELLRGRAPLAGFRWGDPLRAERVELKDVAVTDNEDGGRWAAQSLVVEGFDLARFEASYDGAFPVEVRTARALAALTLRRAEVHRFQMTLPELGDTFGAADVILDRYEQGRIAGLVMNGAEITAKDEKAPSFKFAEIKTGGLDARRLLAGLSAATWYPGTPSGRLHVDSASVSGFSGEMLKRYGISLGSITFETANESDKLSRSRTRVEGFVLAAPPGLQGLQTRLVLQSMGLKDVRLGFDCASSADRAKSELGIGPCALSAPDLGDIDFSARLIGADEAFWRVVDDGDLTALDQSAAAFASARLVMADKSLLERGLKALATVTGQPLATTRSSLAREVRLYQPSDVLISERMTKLLDTVARFVEQGGTLTIEARPEPPVGIEGLASLWKPGADLVQVLGLSASLSR